MEKIKRKAFEDLLEKDEALQVKANEFIGDGGAEKGGCLCCLPGL